MLLAPLAQFREIFSSVRCFSSVPLARLPVFSRFEIPRGQHGLAREYACVQSKFICGFACRGILCNGAFGGWEEQVLKQVAEQEPLLGCKSRGGLIEAREHHHDLE